MSCPHEKVLDAFFNLAFDKGPHVFEAWQCPACKNVVFVFHKFCESIECPECKHRVASKVSVYRDALNEQAMNG